MKWRLVRLFIVCSTAAFGRQATVLPPDTAGASSIGMERLLNTFTWNGAVRYALLRDGVELQTTHLGRSRLIRGGTLSTQDDYSGATVVRARAWKSTFLRAQVTSAVVRDNRAAELGRLSDHRIGVGMEYAPQPYLSLYGLTGYATSTQLGKQDDGLTYSLGAQARGLSVAEFNTSFRSSLLRVDLGQRQPASESLSVAIDRRFGEEARNVISVGYSNLRRQFYTSASPSVQARYGTNLNLFERSASEVAASDTLYYRLSRSSTVQVAGGVMNRTIQRGLKLKNIDDPASLSLDTRIEEFQLFGAASIDSRISDWMGLAAMVQYQEQEEQHTVIAIPEAPQSVVDAQDRAARRLANNARRTVVGSRLTARLTESDFLTFTGSASILRYDTPDTTNTDDRDELLVTMGVEEAHRFNSALSLTVSVVATLNHLVYLHRFQSANNNWNRMLRLATRVDYEPSENFRTSNAAEVLANYTVYDFEDHSAFVRSFSLRQASWTDSTRVRLSKNIRLDFTGSVRIYERGILRWREFKERPQDYFVEQSYWPQVTVRRSTDMTVGVGFRYFSQDRYRYNAGRRSFEASVKSYGPTVHWFWDVPNFGHFALTGWRETQQGYQTRAVTLSHLLLRVGVVL